MDKECGGFRLTVTWSGYCHGSPLQNMLWSWVALPEAASKAATAFLCLGFGFGYAPFR